MTSQLSIPETLKALSSSPGVYIYKDLQGKIIYVGKAINLSRRVKQYFQRDDAVGDKTPILVSEINSIDTIETESEFDALLLEAKLIKFYQPKYNVISKDDKSPLYITITIQEELPRVGFARKPKKNAIAEEFKNSKVFSNTSITSYTGTPSIASNTDTTTLYFGPFQSAKAARSLLRSLRRVVPYCTQKQRTGKKCFYTHLGLCYPCPSYIAKLPDSPLKQEMVKEYRSHMFRLRDILSGKAVSVITDMEKEMESLASQERFEEAASIRNQLQALRSILTKRYDPTVYVQSDTMLDEIFQQERGELRTVLQKYYPQLKELERIECFDISNIQGTNATASMVVMTGGRIDKNEYRKFKIRSLKTPNDFAMMSEALSRRFKHPEWEYPDLLVIDGGKGQVGIAQKTLEKLGFVAIPIIGLAKREEEIVVPVNDDWKIIRLPFSSGGLKMLQRLRDEAHRFAITYHKLLRSKQAQQS